MKWFLDGTTSLPVPAGHKKIFRVTGPSGLTQAQVQAVAQAQPDAVWYILGEPNRIGDYSTVTQALVEGLHDTYALVHAVNAQLGTSMRVTSPAVLNWDFTCIGCGSGYKSGRTWMDEFRLAYLARYGLEPQVDIWAMDVYPIDWGTKPSLRFDIIEAQITGLRFWPHLQGKPIWITELATLWGWDSSANDPSCFDHHTVPAGTYQTQAIINYMDQVFDWLEANATAMNIQRWVQFISYSDLVSCNSAAYAGISLFDGPSAGANLTATGQYFRDRAHGQD